MWELYKLLSPYLPADLTIKWTELLKKVLHEIPDARLVFVLNLLYGKPYMYDNPLDIVTQLSKGLRQNDFVSFAKFVRGLSNGK